MENINCIMFAKWLIDKSKDGVIYISDLPDYVIEFLL